MDQQADNQPGAESAPLVEVVPLGRVNQTAAAVAAANLQAIFGLNAAVSEPWPEPTYALVPTRGQYDAGPILLALAQGGPGPPLRLGLTGRDLCLPFLSYVFGEAQVEGRAAVVSLHRLRDAAQGGTVPRALMLERLAKIALHEIAHVLGLVHCRAPGCLMNFSSSLAGLDRLRLGLCPACNSRLAWQRRRLLGQASRAPAGPGPPGP
ncbi:MAG: peptidase M54 [Desulfarculus sp.]|nr:MAG: peptidase M54 [Desulfarculus sp.]